MLRTCAWCGIGIITTRADARYCTSKCRVYAHRATFPAELINAPRWIRYATDKRPLRISGRAASSTNPATWATYAEARTSKAGIGLGFVLGDGFAGIDLDHCLIDGHLTPAASDFVAEFPGHYIEISPSGDGLHIWGTAEPGTGVRIVLDSGLHYERYSTGRYFTMTGKAYQRGTLLPL